MNYYMYNGINRLYSGGNNFGIWAGSSVTTMYADTANYHADSLANEVLFTLKIAKAYAHE